MVRNIVLKKLLTTTNQKSIIQYYLLSQIYQ